MNDTNDVDKQFVREEQPDSAVRLSPADLHTAADSADLLPDGNCPCEWLGEETPEIAPCGGCENNVRLYRDDPVHWRGLHWHLHCAFEEAKYRTSACANAKE